MSLVFTSKMAAMHDVHCTAWQIIIIIIIPALNFQNYFNFSRLYMDSGASIFLLFFAKLYHYAYIPYKDPLSIHLNKYYFKHNLPNSEEKHCEENCTL